MNEYDKLDMLHEDAKTISKGNPFAYFAVMGMFSIVFVVLIVIEAIKGCIRSILNK